MRLPVIQQEPSIGTDRSENVPSNNIIASTSAGCCHVFLCVGSVGVACCGFEAGHKTQPCPWRTNDMKQTWIMVGGNTQVWTPQMSLCMLLNHTRLEMWLRRKIRHIFLPKLLYHWDRDLDRTTSLKHQQSIKSCESIERQVHRHPCTFWGSWMYNCVTWWRVDTVMHQRRAHRSTST